MKRLAIGALLVLATAGAGFGQTAETQNAVFRGGHFVLGVNEAGMVTSLKFDGDAAGMEWVKPQAVADGLVWGEPMWRMADGKLAAWGNGERVSENASGDEVRFEREGMEFTLTQRIEGDALVQRFALKNTGSVAVTLKEGDFGICVPLPDDYPDAQTALRHRCDVHVWTGGSASWINAERMDGEGPQLGLVVKRGALAAYSLADVPRNSNDRGVFVLHPGVGRLQPGETKVLEWSVFWHAADQGWGGFFKKAEALAPGFIRMQADRYTVFPGEKLHVTAESKAGLAGASVTVNGRQTPATVSGNTLSLDVAPSGFGDQVVTVEAGGRKTWLRGYASPAVKDLLAARARFVIEHQQEHAPGKAIDGAFVAYDNETHQMILEKRNDENGGRERVGMGVMLALYWPRCEDATLKREIETSLHLFWHYVTAHLQGTDGTVYNDTDNPKQRLYNYPWVAWLHLAMYRATGEGKYLDWYVKTMEAFYQHGGVRFYPIDMPIREGLAALQKADRVADRAALLKLYVEHAERILATGTAMPKSEVNYEQSIVAPACNILMQVYEVTGEEKYRSAAEPFYKALLAFNGEQPDYHLHDVAIRHWDDYWFGKGRMFGDTFPHYWSTLTALALDNLARVEPEKAEVLRARAMGIVDNNLSMFRADGSASCAYVYPLTVNGRKGQFWDARANDQDWALVHWLMLTEK